MMNIRYKRMESQHLDAVVKLYIDYYNTYEGGCWTYDKAYKRLHQLMTIEDALCFIRWLIMLSEDSSWDISKNLMI